MKLTQTRLEHYIKSNKLYFIRHRTSEDNKPEGNVADSSAVLNYIMSCRAMSLDDDYIAKFIYVEMGKADMQIEDGTTYRFIELGKIIDDEKAANTKKAQETT